MQNVPAAHIEYIESSLKAFAMPGIFISPPKPTLETGAVEETSGKTKSFAK